MRSIRSRMRRTDAQSDVERRVIADSNACVVVEGNQYFPADSVKREYLRDSDTHTVCSWKGTASYYDVVVGRENQQGCRVVLPRARRTRRRTFATTSPSGAASRWSSDYARREAGRTIGTTDGHR